MGTGIRRPWLLLVLAVAVVAGGSVYLRVHHSSVSVAVARREAAAGCGSVEQAFRAHESDVWLGLGAVVERNLPDQYGRFRHQRFIVRCASGLTVLVVNDVSIGHRVPVAPGDPVGVHGQYVWDPQGGLVHFTHASSGSNGGWILFRGHIYA